jgi:hypothetical protein
VRREGEENGGNSYPMRAGACTAPPAPSILLGTGSSAEKHEGNETGRGQSAMGVTNDPVDVGCIPLMSSAALGRWRWTDRARVLRARMASLRVAGLSLSDGKENIRSQLLIESRDVGRKSISKSGGNLHVGPNKIHAEPSTHTATRRTIWATAASDLPSSGVTDGPKEWFACHDETRPSPRTSPAPTARLPTQPLSTQHHDRVGDHASVSTRPDPSIAPAARRRSPMARGARSTAANLLDPFAAGAEVPRLRLFGAVPGRCSRDKVFFSRSGGIVLSVCLARSAGRGRSDRFALVSPGRGAPVKGVAASTPPDP